MSDLNDPRVLFAAERTLLAWNRTSLAWMGFGFAIERFGLFAQMLGGSRGGGSAHGMSFWVGLAFVVVGTISSMLSLVQYRRVLDSLNPREIPPGYSLHLPSYLALTLIFLGLAVAVYLIVG